jgi:hypothetical protein
MAKTILESGAALFAQMIKQFGAVTVMNAHIYAIDDYDFSAHTAQEIYEYFNAQKKLATLDTLKMANVTVEGPTKTVTGGQYSNPLIKFGKTARFEMQDALGRADALEAFGGVVNEYTDELYGTIQAVHSTEDFTGAKLIMGESFFIDRTSGKQVDVILMFYQVLPDSIFNLTQDAEGDASVFDMNGDLLTTTILVPDKTGVNKKHGVFYSILPAGEVSTPASYDVAVDKDGKVTVTRTPSDSAVSYKYSTDGGLTWAALDSTTTVANNAIIDIKGYKGGDSFTVVENFKAERPAA